MYRVDVPAGATAGQVIRVRVPLMEGEITVNSTVPYGVGAGGTFLLRLHPELQAQLQEQASATPVDDATAAEWAVAHNESFTVSLLRDPTSPDTHARVAVKTENEPSRRAGKEKRKRGRSDTGSDESSDEGDSSGCDDDGKRK
jgi:hypothetical protein